MKYRNRLSCVIITKEMIESEIVEASQITERTVTFTQECDDIAKTTVLDAVTWLESDTLYTVEFQENQIEIAGNGVQS